MLNIEMDKNHPHSLVPHSNTFHCVQYKTYFILEVLNHLLKRKFMFNTDGKQAKAVY